MKLFKLFLIALLSVVAGGIQSIYAQTAVTVGSQVTDASDIVSGKAYLLQYQGNGTNTPWLEDAGTYYNCPNSAGNCNLASVWYLIDNGDDTWKIENAYTGKYWPKPTGNANLVGTDAASAGSWALNFSSGVAAPTCNGYRLNRNTPNLVGWNSGSGSVTQVKIYEVTASTLATSATYSAFADKNINVSATEAASISEGHWYVMSQRSRTSYVFENTSDHELKHTRTKPSGSAIEKAGYLVRLLSADGGKYYLQNGFGNYMGAIDASTNVPTTALGQEAITVAKIGGTDGHFYLQGTTNGVILDGNDFTGGDPSSVVGLGTDAPSTTDGNNDWAFYPVDFVDSWVPTISEVYTINNTNSDRGAMMYNGSSFYVWSSGKSGTFSATDPNCQWVLVPTGTANQYYLYNVGAGKFAIPSGTGSTASWIFSSDAVAVKFITQNDGTKKIKTVTTDTYAAVSNGYNGPIINYNDVGGNFTITKVDGDQSTAATAAVNKLVDNVTALTAIPNDGTSDWYVIRIKSHASYADKYIFPVDPEITYNGTNYPLSFDHGANIRPAVNDANYYSRITREGNMVYWQMPNGKYLYGVNNKFPVSTLEKSTFSMNYTSGSGIRMWGGSRYAVPYLLDNQYFIGETTSPGNAYYDVYPIDLSAAGLVAWQVLCENASESTKITCSRSDVSGLTSVYKNGYFFLPSDVTPVDGEFTATVEGNTLTLNTAIDANAKTITVTVLPMLTISSPMAEASFTWNGITKTGKTVTFYYTGGTISDNTITVSYTGNEFTSPVLSQNAWDGTTDVTITCTMTPAFFSSTYGEKWIRIGNALGGGTVMGLNTSVSGETVKMKALDYFDKSQLWCFVGSAESFKIYNKVAGSSLQMASSSTNITNSVTAVMAAAGADATDWKLMNKLDASNGPGWAIYFSGHDGSLALNAKGGTSAGNNIGYYDNGDGNGGSRWLFSDASGEVSLALSGLDTETMTVYTQNIANLPITIGSSTSQTLLTKDNFVTKTAYVPNNSELTFGAPAMFMNYGFTGYDGSEQTKTVTSSTTPQTITATFSVVRPDARYLWEPLRIYNGEGEKDYYRIPAIVTAKNGDVLAINDRRWNNDTDLGNNSGTAANPVDHHIDIIGVASSDNGNTWSNEFMIMDGTGSGALAGYGDAAVVADRENNKVLVMACAGNVFYTGQNNSYHQTIQRTILTHNGTSWVAEAPRDVTNQFYAGSLASSDGMFIGSGAISQSKIIKKGDYYRIYCTVLERSSSNFVFYSDDFGLTWTMMGSTAPAHDNEPKVDELPDGSVLLSVRKYYGRTFNVWTWDDNTYTTGSWGTAVASNNQADGISFGNNSTNGDIRMIPAIKKSTGEVVTLAMQSVPTANSRAEVSLYYKELDPSVTYTPTTIAQNWSSRFLITPHSSAYSSFNPQPDGRIAFYMEEAPKSATGFYMCYVPLTLDEITDNQYTGVPATYPVTLNTVGSASYATLYLPFDVTTDANTKAYVIKKVGDGSAKMTELTGGEIAARTAVVLVNETSNRVTFNVASGLSPQVTESENLLKGTLVSRELDLAEGNGNYSLGRLDGQIGFIKYKNGENTTITLGANKAYLVVPSSAGNGVKGFTLSFGGEDGISKIVNSTSVNGTWYDLNGRRLSGAPAAKGVYIVGGKKVVVK